MVILIVWLIIRCPIIRLTLFWRSITSVNLSKVGTVTKAWLWALPSTTILSHGLTLTVTLEEVTHGYSERKCSASNKANLSGLSAPCLLANR